MYRLTVILLCFNMYTYRSVLNIMQRMIDAYYDMIHTKIYRPYTRKDDRGRKILTKCQPVIVMVGQNRRCVCGWDGSILR